MCFVSSQIKKKNTNNNLNKGLYFIQWAGNKFTIVRNVKYDDRFNLDKMCTTRLINWAVVSSINA